MKFLLVVVFSVMASWASLKTSSADLPVRCTQTGAFYSYVKKGYMPVEDTWPDESFTTDTQNGLNLPDNPLYKNWCIQNFINGEQIYNAYREIAFNITYRAEPPKTDFWQTPIETEYRKEGDCEDSVFLFFSLLSEADINGDIVWGWVVDKQHNITFAHVWYRLFDKHGRPYVVEGFSKEWNGIIPEELINKTEERIPSLILRHNEVINIAEGFIPEFMASAKTAQNPWNIFMNNNHIIENIIHKLQTMFMRYQKQKIYDDYPEGISIANFAAANH